MTEAIGRADYVLGVDNTGVKKGVTEAEQLIVASGKKAEDAYASSAYRSGVLVGNAIKTGAKVLATGAAAMFAIATKGALELSDVTADYRAETGATADEAARAGKAINEMSGRNIQPLREIGAAATKVRTDLGLVGDEADQTTERFLKFARATKQEAAASVVAFDDILDAWGLTAGDAQSIMDKLIVSHQRYGGSITDNQRSLASLAPQLRALNMTVDDGIGLLNLFASSGLDASVAQRALNKAIANLPKNTTFAEFVTELASIEDPAQRAARASEVFGAMAGPKLANAIRPGVASLDTFKVSVEESTGATEEAAAALDDTFGARAQLMLNKFGSAIRGLGADWGPLLTGAASAGSLLTSIFGEAAIRKFGSKLVEVFRGIGAEAGGALSDGITSIWTGAGGTVVGNFIASRIETMVDSTKNSKIAAAIRAGAAKAGALWGVVFAGAQGVAGKLASGLATAIAATPLAGPVRAAVLAAAIQLGTLQGTAAGSAFAAAAAAAIIAAPLIVLKVALDIQGDIDRQGEDLKKKTAEYVRVASDTDLANSIEGVKKELEKIPGNAFDARNKTIDVLNMLIAEQNARLAQSQASAQAAGLAIAGEIYGPPVIAKARAAVATFAGKIKDDLAGAGIAEEAMRQGRLAGFAVAQGITEKREAVDDAWLGLLEAIKKPISATRETAKLLGRLVSTKLIEGMNSADPAVRAQARATKQLILDRLEELRPRAGTLSKEAMASLRRGMKSADPDIRRASTEIYNAAISGPKDLTKEKGFGWGKAIGAGVAAGLNAQAAAVGAAAGNLARIVAAYLETHSPAELGPLSRSGGPEGWGRRLVDLMAKGAASGLPTLNATLNRGLSLSGFDEPWLSRVVASAAPAATIRVEHAITAEGARNLAAAGFDERQVAAALAEPVDATGLLGNLRALQSMSGS